MIDNYYYIIDNKLTRNEFYDKFNIDTLPLSIKYEKNDWYNIYNKINISIKEFNNIITSLDMNLYETC